MCRSSILVPFGSMVLLPGSDRLGLQGVGRADPSIVIPFCIMVVLPARRIRIKSLANQTRNFVGGDILKPGSET